MKMTFLLLLLTAFSAQAQLVAQTTPQKSATKIKRVQPVTKEKNWSLDFNYGVSTNMANESSDRVYEHSLEAEYGYSFGRLGNGVAGMNIGTGLLGYADGNNIRNEKTNPIWNDIYIGFSYGQRVLGDSKLVFGITENLPTGYESQTEGFKSVIDAMTSLATPFLKGDLMIINMAGVSTIMNSYAESETTLASNPDYVGIYSLGINYLLGGGFSIGAKGIAKSVHFMNNENQLRTSVSEFIRYKADHFSVSLSYLLGNYDENENYRFLYIDDTRRVFKLGVTLEI